MSTPYEDEDYFLPLEDQRVFGAGITRKRVPFVRSTDHELSTLTGPSSAPSTPAGSGGSIADKYLSIVMQKPKTSSSEIATATASSSSTTATTDHPAIDRSRSAPLPLPPSPTSQEREREQEDEGLEQEQEQKQERKQPTTCEICALPLATTSKSTPTPESASTSTSTRDQKPHESTLAHQVCLTHSIPPSHLDRTRPGLRYLESYGWNPDSRVGLGAPGREGIREPVKGKIKADTVGLGVPLPSSTAAAVEKRKREREEKKRKGQKLNAKQVKLGSLEARRRGEKLREMFYRDEEVLRYLGSG